MQECHNIIKTSFDRDLHAVLYISL